ncbi:MAG: hypothetical protein KDK69_03750, partial [Chlamydiia bacterium]|nr:hypothetical protein [Chlamydiia bacterium]
GIEAECLLEGAALLRKLVQGIVGETGAAALALKGENVSGRVILDRLAKMRRLDREEALVLVVAVGEGKPHPLLIERAIDATALCDPRMETRQDPIGRAIRHPHMPSNRGGLKR